MGVNWLKLKSILLVCMYVGFEMRCHGSDGGGGGGIDDHNDNNKKK